jgi:hypothetical protein
MSSRPYISPGMTESVRHMFNRGLQHTYTRIPYTYAPKDGYARQAGTPGSAVNGVKCRYLPKPLIREYDTGRTTMVVPPVTDDTLLVAWDDPITVGDHVTNVRALPTNGATQGMLLLSEQNGVAAEAVVVSEAEHAGLGPPTLRRLVLRDPEEREVFPLG